MGASTPRDAIWKQNLFSQRFQIQSIPGMFGFKALSLETSDSKPKRHEACIADLDLDPIKLMTYFTFLGPKLIQSTATSVYSLITQGPDRPLWDPWLHISTNLLRQGVQFDLHTLGHARAGLDLIKMFCESANVTSSNVDITPVEIPVDLEDILHLETTGDPYRVTRGAPGYPIPTEVITQTESKNYKMKGEWIHPQHFNKIIEGDRRIGCSKKVILYLHGGCYFFGSSFHYRPLTSRLAMDTGYDIFALDYRLAPENPFPAALHDVLAAYLWLLNPMHEAFDNQACAVDRTGYAPEDIIIAGDSAGAGLSVAFLIYLDRYLRKTDESLLLPFPSCSVLFSPWIDLTFTTESVRENAIFDYLPAQLHALHDPVLPKLHHPTYQYILGEFLERQLPDIDASARIKKPRSRVDSGVSIDNFTLIPDYQRKVDQYARHPLISPMFHDSYQGLPPMFISVGESEMLRDESLELAKMYHESNKETKKWARLEVYHDMVHDFQMMQWHDSANLAITNAVSFLKDVETGNVSDECPQDCHLHKCHVHK